MQEIKSVRDADVAGKRVLVAVDFNVPLKDGIIVDDARIRAALPTLELLHGRGAKIVVMTHIGRPDGREVEGLRVAPVAHRLGELMKCRVTVAPEESDSVENVPLDVERPDAAEQEELERYKEALGLEKKPDDFSQDNWGQTPRQTGAGEDEPRDPASW